MNSLRPTFSRTDRLTRSTRCTLVARPVPQTSPTQLIRERRTMQPLRSCSTSNSSTTTIGPASSMGWSSSARCSSSSLQSGPALSCAYARSSTGNSPRRSCGSTSASKSVRETLTRANRRPWRGSVSSCPSLGSTSTSSK